MNRSKDTTVFHFEIEAFLLSGAWKINCSKICFRVSMKIKTDFPFQKSKPVSLRKKRESSDLYDEESIRSITTINKTERERYCTERFTSIRLLIREFQFGKRFRFQSSSP
ncbi:hypothetical protein NPIL_698791 [Nephila pilipes]|uniref:Uncharacterized protein n=1 Tax=Nephila pilipes TaxID=299642 RepID=A0A8X6PPH9_NEPPI|nr:hypothetical protein NPIL_698791 [Nephila pilipes]